MNTAVQVKKTWRLCLRMCRQLLKKCRLFWIIKRTREHISPLSWGRRWPSLDSECTYVILYNKEKRPPTSLIQTGGLGRRKLPINKKKTKSRKRKKRPDTWKINKRKFLRNSGRTYLSTKGKVVRSTASTYVLSLLMKDVNKYLRNSGKLVLGRYKSIL